MTFDSRRAAREPGYYDEYEAEVAANLRRTEALAARLWGPLPDDPQVTLDSIKDEIDSLTDDRFGSLAIMPFSRRIARKQVLRAHMPDVEEPYKAIELTAYSRLRLGKKASLIGASVCAELVGPNAPGVGWYLHFGEQTRIAGGHVTNLSFPRPEATPLAIHRVIEALRVSQEP